MKQRLITGAAVFVAGSLLLAACAGDGGEGGNGGSVGADDSVTITLGQWSQNSGSEFDLLAQAFNEQNPDITVELVGYSAESYDTQMIADLAAGTAPDMYAIKNLKAFYTYMDGGQMMDVTDVANGLDSEITGLDVYTVDGTTYAIPYRVEPWLLYYNKDLFDEAGVEYPDGTWTWEDYGEAAEALTENLANTDTPAYGTYHHYWPQTPQSFATAQSPDADFSSAEWEYMVPYYERVLELQDTGAMMDYGTMTTNSLTYQSAFGNQDAAMLLMGAWYISGLQAERERGEADTFDWGLAPVPQLDASTADNPITFGDPKGIGINPAIDEDLTDAAKEFLSFIGSEAAAAVLAENAVTTAVSNDTIADIALSAEGMPNDGLSRFTYTTYDLRPESVVAPTTTELQNILSDAHSAIMTESVSPEEGIARAMERARAEVLGN